MKKQIIAILLALNSFYCLGGEKEKQPPIKQPDYLAEFEKGIHNAKYPKIKQEEWFTKHIEKLKSSAPTNSFEEIDFVTIPPTNQHLTATNYVHYATGKSGYHYFSKTNWIVLVTENFHSYPNIDAVLVMNENKDFYTIETHPCGNLEIYSDEELEIDSLENLLKTVSRKGNKWKPYK